MRATIFVAVGLMLALYCLPWVVNPGASLSLNAYDLAEWASLHPAVRDAALPLLTSFLLRLPLACLALLVAFTTRRGLFSSLIVLLLAVAVLRPEFFRALDDPNYRQQAALALIALIGGAVGLSGVLPRERRWIAAGVAAVGANASVYGLAQGCNLMRGFGLPTQIGLGGIGLALAFVILTVILAVEEIRQRRRATSPRSTAALNQPEQR